MEPKNNIAAYTTEYCLSISIIDEQIHRTLSYETYYGRIPKTYRKGDNQDTFSNIKKKENEFMNDHVGMKYL